MSRGLLGTPGDSHVLPAEVCSAPSPRPRSAVTREPGLVGVTEVGLAQPSTQPWKPALCPTPASPTLPFRPKRARTPDSCQHQQWVRWALPRSWGAQEGRGPRQHPPSCPLPWQAAGDRPPPVGAERGAGCQLAHAFHTRHRGTHGVPNPLPGASLAQPRVLP